MKETHVQGLSINTQCLDPYILDPGPMTVVYAVYLLCINVTVFIYDI